MDRVGLAVGKVHQLREQVVDFDQPAFARGDEFPIGWVYCLSNPAMPGLVKIGYTNRSTSIRAEELSFGSKDGSATGVPLPFEIVKDWQVPGDKSVEIEQQIHRILQEFRVPARGRWRAKEFFYLEPHQAIAAIERALKELDWWAVSQAEIARIDEELAARESRRKAEVARQNVLAETEAKLKQEIAEEQSRWTQDAKLPKGEDGLSYGLKWGLIWFVGSWVVLGMGGAKDSIGWFCLALGVIVYYATKDGPVNAYLNSQEACNELDRIEREIRQHVAPNSAARINRVAVTDSHAAINTSNHKVEPNTQIKDFRQRLSTGLDLDKQRRERQRLAVKDGWSSQVKNTEASSTPQVASLATMSPTKTAKSRLLDVSDPAGPARTPCRRNLCPA